MLQMSIFYQGNLYEINLSAIHADFSTLQGQNKGINVEWYQTKILGRGHVIII